MSQRRSKIIFCWACLVLQVLLAILFLLFAKYHPSADAKAATTTQEARHELHKTMDKYPMIIDIHMMLFVGFGFLMTPFRRYGFSAVGMTMLITCIVTEWAVFLQGILKIGDDFKIHVGFLEILEGSLASASVLITFGVVLGKLNTIQLLVLSLIQSSVFVFNSHLGYHILGAVDIGGAVFIHAFGAYFGLSVSMVHRKRQVSKSAANETTRYLSEVMAMLGTTVLWVFWPSFNAVLADGDARHRAFVNTYMSLLGSTVATFIVSAFFSEERKLEMVDIQNASLSGGVAVGAIADLMLEPYVAFIVGSLTGALATFGFRKLTKMLFERFRLHDTCGVHNLHGMPGVISGILSIIMCGIASQDTYGANLYMVFPRAVPPEDAKDELAKVRALFHTGDEHDHHAVVVEPGDGRSLGMQAVFQTLTLGITLILAVVTGILTGLLLNVESLFHPLDDTELFDDAPFWICEEFEEGEVGEGHVNAGIDESFDEKAPEQSHQPAPALRRRRADQEDQATADFDVIIDNGNDRPKSSTNRIFPH